MFELAISFLVSFRSLAIVTVSCGGCQQLDYLKMFFCTYQWWERVPRPECDHEAKPREEEDSAIDVDYVQTRYRTSFVVDWVDLRGLEEKSRVIHFCRMLGQADETCRRLSGVSCNARTDLAKGEVTGDTGKETTLRRPTAEDLIDIRCLAVSLANISWRVRSDERAFSGPPRAGQCFQANVVSPRVIPCDDRDFG
jgi:hypothetical protein